MTSLKTLWLSNTSITDSELTPFRQSMPNVKVRK